MIFIFRLPSELNQKSGAHCRSPEQQMNFLPLTEIHFNEYRVWILIVSFHIHVLFVMCHSVMQGQKPPTGSTWKIIK